MTASKDKSVAANSRRGHQAMTRFPVAVSILFALIFLPTHVVAGVPQPDAVLVGSLIVNGQKLTAASGALVIARVGGSQNVGAYRMGQSATAGDNYVLRIRIETPIAGNPVAPNAAQVGQQVTVIVRLADGTEVEAATHTIGPIGTIVQRDLVASILPGNCFVDSQLDLLDQEEILPCLTGPAGTRTVQCACADTDGDSDVDLRDWSRFQDAFMGTPSKTLLQNQAESK